jgi:hypothetical protein
MARESLNRGAVTHDHGTKGNVSPDHRGQTPLCELALLFARLGTIAFGGPAAHVAIMQNEVVRPPQVADCCRARWMMVDRASWLMGIKRSGTLSAASLTAQSDDALAS